MSRSLRVLKNTPYASSLARPATGHEETVVLRVWVGAGYAPPVLTRCYAWFPATLSTSAGSPLASASLTAATATTTAAPASPPLRSLRPAGGRVNHADPRNKLRLPLPGGPRVDQGNDDDHHHDKGYRYRRAYRLLHAMSPP